ncbi:hypothetical protein Daus18300_008225 [Diaporthe australafricana]|uniref:BTB domain-containing protein n=1 Tax=Diaporthe australafricana TaxID=127596 RepID=A0ABR3WJ64_9PEZI
MISQEGQTGKVTITNFEQADVDCLLKFVYTGVIELQKSYPTQGSLAALMKIWKMADYFCLSDLHDLVIRAATQGVQKMALSFCAADPPPAGDPKRRQLYRDEFEPAVKALYRDEMEALKTEFAPLVLGLAVNSIHSLFHIEEFEKLLQDVPSFSSDWAIALMKGLANSPWLPKGGIPDECDECEEKVDKGVVNTFGPMCRSSSQVLCRYCFGSPALTDWKFKKL